MDQEADFLSHCPPATRCIRITGRLSAPGFSALPTEYFPGTSPQTMPGRNTCSRLAEQGGDRPLDLLMFWCDLFAAVAAPDRELWRQVNVALAGKHSHPALSRRLCAVECSRGQLPQFAGVRLGRGAGRGSPAGIGFILRSRLPCWPGGFPLNARRPRWKS